jgi:peptide deformylase
MAVRPIRVYPDPILKVVCEAVTVFDADLAALAQDLEDTMVASGHSVGVAASQIGDTRRVVIVDVSKSKLGKDDHHGRLLLVNPRIVERQGQQVFREGCMSVPDYTGNVARACEITLEYSDLQGGVRQLEARGFEAVAIQHELDHLDGLLFLDRVSSLKTDVFRRKGA